MNVQFGCGSNILQGWHNFDEEIDISKKLPFEDESIENIFIEHCLEHVTQNEALEFLDEANRILIPSGKIRIAVPSIVKIFNSSSINYCRFTKENGWSNGDMLSAVRSIMNGHGHQSWWTQGLLHMALRVAGFNPRHAEIGISTYSVFCGLEGHGRIIGDEFNQIETIIAEGVKNR